MSKVKFKIDGIYGISCPECKTQCAGCPVLRYVYDKYPTAIATNANGAPWADVMAQNVGIYAHEWNMLTRFIAYSKCRKIANECIHRAGR